MLDPAVSCKQNDISIVVKVDTSRLLRCTACGLRSVWWKFGVGAMTAYTKPGEDGPEAPHALDVGYRTSLSEPGHRGGFSWTKEPMVRADIKAMAKVMKAAAGRLDDLLAALDAVDESSLQAVCKEIRKQIGDSDDEVERFKLRQKIEDLEQVVEAEKEP